MARSPNGQSSNSGSLRTISRQFCRAAAESTVCRCSRNAWRPSNGPSGNSTAGTSFGMYPPCFAPVAQERERVAARARQIAGPEPSLIRETAHELGVATGRAKALAVDVKMALVVEHACAAIEGNGIQLRWRFSLV